MPAIEGTQRHDTSPHRRADLVPPGQSVLNEELAQLNYEEGSAKVRPGGRGALARKNTPKGAAGVNPDEDAKLSDSMLVAGIQPDRIGGNFLARQWYQGRLGGPETGDQGTLALPYDDVNSVEGDTARVELYGNYASENVSWSKLVEEDPTGAEHVETLVDQCLATAAGGGVIYAHSGGGAATMAALRRALEVNGASEFRALKLRSIQVQGLEAVITAEQVQSLGKGYAKMGIKLVVDNTVAAPASEGGEAGSETWKERIAAGITEAGDTPHVTHQFDGDPGRGDSHSDMVPALYGSGKMPARTAR